MLLTVAVLLILIIAALIGADQAVKYWAVNSLQPVESMDFIRIGDFKILDLTYVENDGAVFGSMSGQRWFLVGFTSIVIIIGIFILFRYMKHSKMLTSALILFVAGGIGNLIDRIRLGYVVDMFEIKLFEFAVFNVADICVVAAIACLFVYIIFIDPKLDAANKKAAEKAEDDER